MDDNVREMMFLIVEQLKAYVDGNEDALLELTQVLDSGRHDADVVPARSSSRRPPAVFHSIVPRTRRLRSVSMNCSTGPCILGSIVLIQEPRQCPSELLSSFGCAAAGGAKAVSANAAAHTMMIRCLTSRHIATPPVLPVVSARRRNRAIRGLRWGRAQHKPALGVTAGFLSSRLLGQTSPRLRPFFAGSRARSTREHQKSAFIISTSPVTIAFSAQPRFTRVVTIS